MIQQNKLPTMFKNCTQEIRLTTSTYVKTPSLNHINFKEKKECKTGWMEVEEDIKGINGDADKQTNT